MARGRALANDSTLRLQFAVAIWCLFVAGCGSEPQRKISNDNNDITTGDNDNKELNHSTMDVFYATDRHVTGSEEPNVFYGTKRGPLALGKASVSIPRDHRMGHLEQPSIWKFEWHENPDRHVMVIHATPQSEKDFMTDLKASVEKSAEKSAFVFVHGFSVSFKDALRRTGQLAYDLGFDGAAICYTWPSQESVSKSGYLADLQTAEWAAPDLAVLLQMIRSATGTSKIHLIAHSMGNKVLSLALERISSDSEHQPKRFHQVVLTAPDIDADLFQRDTAPKILPLAERYTLYASNKDWAMSISQDYAAGYRRLGDSHPAPVVMEGIESIDVSSVDTSFVGHEYYGDNRSVLSDLFLLIRHDFGATKRNLRERGLGAGKYWIFEP